MPKLRNSKARCFDCGRKAVHAHHVVPRSLGGTTTVNLCAECHGKVHNRKFVDSSALVKKGLQKLNATGYHHGVAPYGFTYVAGKKVKDEREQGILDFIYNKVEEGLTNGEIAKGLNEKGLPKRNGKSWTRGCVWGIVNKHRSRDKPAVG